jgi:hypothetical protein
MRVRKKAVQLTLLVCLLASTVCVKGAFFFIASQHESARPEFKAEISFRLECRAKSKCKTPHCQRLHPFPDVFKLF